MVQDSRKAAQPGSCLICGAPLSKPCYSHTVPQYCLREIAADGKVLTLSEILKTNLTESKKGIKQAAIFRSVCRKCDNEFFKEYETPGALIDEPSDAMLGQIAAKDLLRLIYKDRQELYTADLMESLSDYFQSSKAVKSLDLPENEASLNKALSAAKGINSTNCFHVIFHQVLPYIVPIAFQGSIVPISGYGGDLINDVFNPNPQYKIQSLHIAILPSNGRTVVLMFHEKSFKRFRNLERDFEERSLADKLSTVLKIILAYSDEFFLSPKLPESVLRMQGLVALTRRNDIYAYNPLASLGMRGQIEQACNEFAIDGLPDPPNLLLKEYSLT